MPANASHDFILFPGAIGKTWFGVSAVNVGTKKAYPGMLALHRGASSAYLPVWITTTISSDESRRAYGIFMEDHAPSARAYVVFGGLLERVLVTGTVAVNDWLIPCATPIGSMKTGTTTATRLVIAAQSHSGAASHIRALVLPRRY